MDTKLVELQDISKSYSKVLALEHVNLDVGHAEIVGLIGDNGAGKSTLIKVISGVHAPDSGEIRVRGQKVAKWSVAEARAAGIETVYQDRALVEQQTIVRNIFMGRERTGRFGGLKLAEQYAEAERLMRTIGFTSKVFAPDSIVANLSGGERQGVAIARALYFKATLLILDEPTTSLSLTESEKVFGFVRHVKEEGSSCLFISHNIYHTYDVADRFVILDRGKVVMEADKKDIRSADILVKEMQDIARTGMTSSGRIAARSSPEGA
jgi:simple sugar transport system ATP-binding protein